MKKYLHIYKSELMSTLQYTSNILFKLISFIVLIFIFMNLWDYIYDNPEQLINGYSKNQMIWYVIVTEIIWGAVDGRRYCRKISDDVKSGNIAYMINKPFCYVLYAISAHLGETTIKAIISAGIGLLMGTICLNSFPILSIPALIIVILSSFLAIIISILFVTFIGLISFVIEDSNPIYWIYSKMTLILGTLFPVEFFPGIFAQIIRFSPIYVTCYGPAKLFVDFSYSNAIEILISQIIYLVIAWTICYSMFRKGVKKLNATGG